MSNGEIPDEVPEADALEQRQEAVDDAPEVVDGDRLEVPEADALDQARAVGNDDEPDPEA